MSSSSTVFRQQLKKELEQWQAEGLLSPEQAQAITARHRLEELGQESTRTLLLAIYVIGAVLIGGGVISFVAAHWAEMPAAIKVVLIVGAMLAAHGTGFYYWHGSGNRPQLGHGLVVLGTLIFGANIGLLAQVFHIHSDWFNGFGIWAVGALAMTYAGGSLPHAAIVLVTSFIYFCGIVDHHPALGCAYPFVLAAAVGPLLARLRNLGMFILLLLALGAAIMVSSLMTGSHTGMWATMLTIQMVGMMYWGLGLLLSPAKSEDYAHAALGLGTLTAVVLTSVLAFQAAAHEAVGLSDYNYGGKAVNSYQFVLLGAAYLLALLGALRGWSVWSRAGFPRGVAGVVLLALLLVLGGLLQDNEVLLTVMSNAGLAALGAGLLHAGFELLDRRLFWSGTVVLLGMIVSRFFEYDTGLLLKALAFTSCGAGVMYAGVKFENYLRQARGQA